MLVGGFWASGGLIAYVLVGYPALAAAMARVRPRPLTSALPVPSASVLVPCHNEADVIETKLRSVRSSDADARLLEVIVVDDGSSDGTADAVRRADPSAVLLVQPQRAGKAAAVNRGVAAASGDIVVLTDATAMFTPSTLDAGLAPFADPEVGVVSGTISYDLDGVGPAVRLYWRYEDAIRRWESASGSTVGVNGNFFAFRRSLFRDLPAGTVNDEQTIALVIAAGGSRIVVQPDAITRDLASSTMHAEAHRRSRMTAGRLHAVTRGPGRGVWKHPALAFRLVSHKLARIALPAAALVNLFSACGVLLRGRRSGVVTRTLATGSVTFAATVVLAAAAAEVCERRDRRVPKPLRVAQLLVRSAQATLVGVVRQVRGGQSVLWSTRREDPLIELPATPPPAG